MAKEYVCNICDQTEKRCGCDKFCWLCQSEYEIRLCEDGQWYCPACREACELEAQFPQKE